MVLATSFEKEVDLIQIDAPSHEQIILGEELGEVDFPDEELASKKSIAKIVTNNGNEEVVVNETLETKEQVEVFVEEVVTEEELELIEESSISSKKLINQPMTMEINNQTIFYENGGELYGQSIIDDDYTKVSTWGGAAIQSGEDGLSTHFIGHNPGIFSVLFSLTIGNQIKITDEQGLPTYYTVADIWIVDNYGYDTNTGVDTWDQITSPYNGEAVTLQTCIDDYTNLIIFAVY